MFLKNCKSRRTGYNEISLQLGDKFDNHDMFVKSMLLLFVNDEIFCQLCSFSV